MWNNNKTPVYAWTFSKAMRPPSDDFIQWCRPEFKLFCKKSPHSTQVAANVTSAWILLLFFGGSFSLFPICRKMTSSLPGVRSEQCHSMRKWLWWCTSNIFIKDDFRCQLACQIEEQRKNESKRKNNTLIVTHAPPAPARLPARWISRSFNVVVGEGWRPDRTRVRDNIKLMFRKDSKLLLVPLHAITHHNVVTIYYYVLHQTHGENLETCVLQQLQALLTTSQEQARGRENNTHDADGWTWFPRPSRRQPLPSLHEEDSGW